MGWRVSGNWLLSLDVPNRDRWMGRGFPCCTVHISALRRKLGDYGRFVLTVRGVGYRLADSPDAEST